MKYERWAFGGDDEMIGRSMFRKLRLLQSRWIIVDLGSWLVGAMVAAELRFELGASPDVILSYLLVGLIAGLTHVALGWFTREYFGRCRRGSFEDLRSVATATVMNSVFWSLVLIAFQPVGFPRTMAVTSGLIALALMISACAGARIIRERAQTPAPDGERAILFGAGEAGEQLARSMRRDPAGKYLPVAFLDDDRSLQSLRLEGIDVQGSRDDIRRVARGTGATALIVAIARAESRLLNELEDRCEAAGLAMLVLPPVSQLVSHGVGVGDVREVDEADLLGRSIVKTDQDAIGNMLHDRRVLVTGAGGSIGSELARTISPFGPSQLILVDRDESALHAVELSIKGRALLDSDDLVLADIRDVDRINEVFERYRPDIVFHAAALKHLPLLEQAPKEAVKTNVMGTWNVLSAARSVGVEVFVNISTDKAANPTSVLGFSKRITERLTTEVNEDAGPGRYLSVRFGNVLGSRGSMLGTFMSQIERGGPVTVTHQDVTRYFMTIPEACELVLQASVVGRRGEVLILDMGEPVRIADVAKRLIRHSRQRIEIVYTGLRPAEKLHEELLAEGERDERPFHPKITHTTVARLSISEVAVDLGDSDADCRMRLGKLALNEPLVDFPQKTNQH
ncbi:MAG: nucleoside-diphosphate sugar epimerase/dehydratase [Candidatus Nanopelagicales bacterium]|nr:nucleoside-diphosphate sugar epimerase/dehydratase [Candidatus Nanopelagicales bacterium]